MQNGIASKVWVKPDMMWEVPPRWTLAEAATVPMAYATAYYALVMRGGMRPGMRVLIHSGAGAVGMAAIRLALKRECEVKPCRTLRFCKGGNSSGVGLCCFCEHSVRRCGDEDYEEMTHRGSVASALGDVADVTIFTPILICIELMS